MKSRIIRRVLKEFSRYKPGFYLEDHDLIVYDREKALSMLRYHSLDLLLPGVCVLDDETKEEILQAHVEEKIFLTRVLKEMEKATGILSYNNIFSIVTKGFSLKRYYPSDCIRTMSDIDILIRPEDVLRSVKVLKKAGYRLIREDQMERQLAYHGELTWENPKNNVLVEIHWDFLNARSARKVANFDPSLIFKKVCQFEIEGVQINTLLPHFELAHLIVHHVIHHYFKRLLWLIDVLLILTSKQVDIKAFKDCVNHLKIERPVHYYLNCLCKIFPDIMPDELMAIKRHLEPHSIRYSFFASLNRPERIFKKGVFAAKLKDKLFRNAFK